MRINRIPNKISNTLHIHKRELKYGILSCSLWKWQALQDQRNPLNSGATTSKTQSILHTVVYPIFVFFFTSTKRIMHTQLNAIYLRSWKIYEHLFNQENSTCAYLKKEIFFFFSYPNKSLKEHLLSTEQFYHC